ncbi:uncharacterized protein EV422DRAFT_508982 [Fimicolochytrium jonesii]|uniref:uncharacterized protein n=1 Tax=Fimicolochytrium jonesii TaxID=1396493 RepID=UPI0022FE2289|nr:uncharacterized protein EV422DRAFT_508982 [Fimicolochytrium jonesii]KAI8817387.1 hypothetical protein EV422DRAFT_508982 [Fimicolochytrium jonesii]
MYVHGEVTDPRDDTTLVVEEIVRTQTIEIKFSNVRRKVDSSRPRSQIVRTVQQAAKRGSRFLTPEDVISLIKYDRAKVNTLRTYLAFRDAQKSAKKRDPNDVIDIAEGEDDTDGNNPELLKGKLKFSWDLINYYGTVLEDDDEDDDDEDQQMADDLQQARLKEADEVTRRMTKEEYMYYSECRQASFVFKRLQRFKKWSELGKYYENKPNGDVIDIWGFLAYEMVRKLTEMALEVKKQWDTNRVDEIEHEQREMEKKNVGLFAKPTNVQKPLQPGHIHEAFRRLQNVTPSVNNFRGDFARTTLALI